MEILYSNLGNLTWQQVVMWAIGGLLIYLAIAKDMEPSLLLPMGFGAILVNLPFAALEIFAPKFLASLMLNDPTVISYTCIFLPLTGIALFPLGWLFVFRNACQGMGKTVLPMISGVVEVVMRVGIVQIAVPHFAFRGVAFAEISAWIGAGAMLMVTYLVYQVRLSKGVSK